MGAAFIALMVARSPILFVHESSKRSPAEGDHQGNKCRSPAPFVHPRPVYSFSEKEYTRNCLASKAPLSK